jgi:Ca2+-binding RTX toxin-like protein
LGPDLQLDGGSSGADEVNGGAGNDRCVATIDGKGNDLAIGGDGIDTRWTDPGDEIKGFERNQPCLAE